MPYRLRFGIALMSILVCSCLASAQVPKARKSHHKGVTALQDFEKRVNDYVAQRKKDSGKLPGPTKSAVKLTENREEIRTRIQQNRGNAKQGDMFTPEITRYFHKQIAAAFAGSRGARVLTSLRRAEPVKEIPLKVNQPYPDGLAIQSMPPTLLQKLPKLPKELEYRIVGNNLVLIDIEPSLVVDVLPDAIPKV